MVSRTIMVAVAVIVIVVIGIGLYYFSNQTPTSLTTSETKTSTSEIKQESSTTQTKSPTTSETKQETPTAILDGESLYNKNCKDCHGAKGVGDTAPALSASNADRSILENGDVEHPSFKDILTPDEITAIIDYLKS